MKKLFKILIFILVSTVSFGQNLSMVAGGNIATTKDRIAFPTNRIGWYGGIAYQIFLKKKLSIQSEIIYSSKGDDTDQTTLGPSFNAFRLNYLNTPVLLTYAFGTRTSVAVGPEFGYLLSAVEAHDGQSNIDFTSQYRPRFDAAACIGLQHAFSKHFAIEVRYNYGFKTFYFVDAAGVRHSEMRAANRVFQTGIRYVLQKPPLLKP